jgi:branched-chain amino acid transport system permease protein
MVEILGVSAPALFGQVLIGVINGSFYALLSLGLAVIFGLLNIVNFAHGATYMMGAFVAWIALSTLGLNYWYALVLSPLVVGGLGMVLERLVLRRIYKLDHIYGLLLTLGLTLVIEGVFRYFYGNAGQPYPMPEQLTGGRNLGFMFMPNYRAWVIGFSIVVCLSAWFVIEKTRLGAYLRAATENPTLVRAFGVNVPLMVMLTYGFGVALAALGGVMAAPIYQVSPLMGSNVIAIVFAVVVIGGMGSIMGAIVTGFGLGIVEGLTKVFYPQGATMVIFLVMALVLLVRPAGLFGKAGQVHVATADSAIGARTAGSGSCTRWVGGLLLLLAVVAPFIGIYPGFVMKALCFALFAAAFNLLIGFAGLMSFGHAAFFGASAYTAGYAMKVWGFPPELGIACGAGVAALLGLGFGWLAIRRQGIYFAMVTLALSQMVYFFFVQAPFSGGEDGLRDVPQGMLFGFIDLSKTMNLYWFIVAIFLIGFFVIHRTIHSPFGQVLKAIRENEPRAISLGYKTSQAKLIAFVISAALAGLAGASKVLVFQIASLVDVDMNMSSEVVLMTLVGGLGTVLGPVIGAVVMVAMDGYLAALGSWVTVIKGLIFAIFVLSFRRGIVGALNQLFRKFAPKVTAPSVAGPAPTAVTTSAGGLSAAERAHAAQSVFRA